MEENEEGIQGYDIEQVLEELNAKYFIVEKFESSDYEDGYVGVYIEDGSEYESILINRGFERIRRNFLLIEISKLKIITEKELRKIKLNCSEKLKMDSSACLFQKRILEVTAIWYKIIDKYLAINKFFKHYGKHKEYYFNITERINERVYKLPLLLVNEEKSLGDFCYYLYQLTYECVKDEIRMDVGYKINDKFRHNSNSRKEILGFVNDLLGEDNFYNDIEDLRHYFIHLYYKDDKFKKDYLPEAHEEVLIKCLQKRLLNKLTNDYEFYHLQIDILNDCYKYLSKLYEIITTKEII